MELADQPDVDVVVVGSGIAGLTVALAAAERGRRVTLLTKGVLASGSSPLAQGGIAAAVGADDATTLHAADTEAAGRGLCDLDVVRRITEAAPASIARLLELGARLDRDGDHLALGREGGHRRARIVHAGGDRTGAELVRALGDAVRASAGITLREGVFASELALRRDGSAGGVEVLGEDGTTAVLRATATVLATGGAGQLYRYTTNPLEVTGDGIAMAARAGALVADLEMVQFHPTALALGPYGAPLPLLSEALRGAGALVVDASGRRFLDRLHPDAELAPRDVVARELWERSTRGEPSFLDLRPLALGRGGLAARFPAAAEACARAGLDPARDLVPLTPAAHYLVGGIWTDEWGRSSIPGLWACGETAATGVHGANRLASNSLLEALVFGRRVAEGLELPCASEVERSAASLRADFNLPLGARLEAVSASTGELRDRLRDAMWRGAGVVRTEQGLAALLDELESLALAAPAPTDRASAELRNLIEVGRLVASAALLRTETRGCHVRADHPAPRSELRFRRVSHAADLLVRARRRTPFAALAMG